MLMLSTCSPHTFSLTPSLREYNALADDLVALGMLPNGSEKLAVVPALTGALMTVLHTFSF
jgi:hypothetical protein